MREADRFDDKILGSGFFSTNSQSKHKLAATGSKTNFNNANNEQTGGITTPMRDVFKDK